MSQRSPDGRDEPRAPPSSPDDTLWSRARQQISSPLGWTDETETERDVEERHDVRYGPHGEPVAERRERIIRVRRETGDSPWVRAFRWLGRLLLGVFIASLILLGVPYVGENGMSVPAFALAAFSALWLLVYAWDALDRVDK